MKAPRASEGNLRALSIRAWVSRRPWLRSLWSWVPAGIRGSVRDQLGAASAAGTEFPRTAAWDLPVPVARTVPTPDPAGGSGCVNIYAYFHGQFGLAECARLYARALLDHGYPVRLHNVGLDIPHGLDDHTLDLQDGQIAPGGLHLFFVNPDYLDAAMDYVGRERLEGGYIMACWFWELEHIPDAWRAAIEQVDEVMVASRFIEGAFRRATEKPIFLLPIPVGEPEDSGLQRRDFGIDEDAFVFLASFDFNSSMERKNPISVIDAFRLAFPAGREDVRLLVKSSNGHRYPEQFMRLLKAAKGDSRIVVRDEVLDVRHVHALHRCVDAYVSLHRAEGFGLGIAECMRQGKPVVATKWSGNVDFMGPSDAFPVGYVLVPVPDGAYPLSAGQHWAEPDVAQAAAYMRRVADDPAAARTVGARAAARIRAELSPQRLAPQLAARLDQLRALREGHVC